MRTQKEIKDFCEKNYDYFLRARFQSIDFFPLQIKSFRKYKSSELLKNFQTIQKEIEELIQNSKEKLGYGYEIVWEQIYSRSVGQNNYPKTIQFTNSKDYLKYISKEEEFDTLCNDLEKLVKRFPILNDWIIQNPEKLIPLTDKLDKIVSVCNYFVNYPKPNMYLREIPLEGIDTKFIEENEKILKVFLDVILDEKNINLNSKYFTERYYLKSNPKLIRFRLLDNESNSLFPKYLTDITLTLPEFEHLKISEKNIFITENLTNFLSFPKVKNSIILFGSGYKLLDLKKCSIFINKNLYYWGDIDEEGFHILSQFRDIFPNVKSFLMDTETYENFSQYSCSVEKSLKSIPKNLTQTELELYQYLSTQTNRNRLEQEKIPFDYIMYILNSLELY